ncbi:HAD family hydrolase [Bacillus sp. B15-48]|uniref:HAD family hydrolase n=1 Tax=Bacillus sp. B15-48 TaxID=1548601 RepID=UPI00193F846F|nr:HAD family hydrolase [Bacillus sp. B15-48]MBM4762767.1 Cof-type HAD-IIB family hydrolase [Bacillus sp. B15-48]
MKCFSIDLDGTLLNSSHEISKKNLQTLNELKEQGHSLILNTGRAYKDVIKIDQIKKMQIPIFCVNGSVLYSATGKLLYEATIPLNTYKKLFSILKNIEDVGILVYTKDGGFPSTLPPLHHKSKEELHSLFNEFDYDIILSNSDLKIYKLIALVHNDRLEKIEKVKESLFGNFNLSIASSFPNNVEITSGDAHKGKAILRYQEMMNVTFDEIFAFGDGGNDLAQFEVATVSVAMGNAPLEIQQSADIITKTNDDDGFAHAVHHLLNL